MAGKSKRPNRFGAAIPWRKRFHWRSKIRWRSEHLQLIAKRKAARIPRKPLFDEPD
jgi:hypothetical protein